MGKEDAIAGTEKTAAELAAGLMQAIESRAAVVGVVGLGYVGLPACIALADAGFQCLGFDTDSRKIAALRAQQPYLSHVAITPLVQAMQRGDFAPTDSLDKLVECDAVLITVPTPLDAHLEPDLSFVQNTCHGIATRLRPGMLIVLESTSYPGTTREVVVPLLEESGLTAERDFFVAFSPEREDPGNRDYTATEIPKVVAGIGPLSGSLVEALYACTHQRVVRVSATEVAEACKILENTFRAVNIALVNELKLLFIRMGIDIWEVIEAAGTKPFGFMPFYPGPGLGGHCVPIDPYYLSWKAREHNVTTRFIELAGEVNRAMPDFVVSMVIRVLNEHSLPIKGSRVLLLGLAYKPDISDDRESPAYPIMRSLVGMGAKVFYNDPHVAVIPSKRDYPEFEGLQSVPVGSNYDLLVILTAHSAYKSLDLAATGVPVLDTRNVVPRGTAGLFRC